MSVYYSERPHWWFFWRQILYLAGGLSIALIALAISPRTLWPVGLLAFLLVVGAGVARYVVWSFTELRITSTTFELHTRTLLGTKEPVTKPFRQIADVQVRQNLAEQLFGIGDVTVIDSGGEKVTAMDVRNTTAVQRLIDLGLKGEL